MLDATPLLRLLGKRRIAELRAQDAVQTQRDLLLNLVGKAADTQFGRDHDFRGIATVADFQARVPLRRFEALWELYLEPRFPVVSGATWPGAVPFFAVTSGTTAARTKHIPVTREIIAGNRKAALDLLFWWMDRDPTARPMAGKTLMLGGSTAFRSLAHGVWSGDLSGIAAATSPLWSAPYIFPRGALALESDWDRKLDGLVEHAPREEIVTLSGTPSWVLMLLDRMRARWGDDPLPNLRLFIHGGVVFDPYRDRFEALTGGKVAAAEVYPASEGFVALQDRGPEEGLRLAADHGVFFEFVPVAELDGDAPTRHWLGTVETGVDYALVVSTCAGLWGHVVGDVVRFLDRDPPRLVYAGRTAHTLSAFGEHVSGGELDRDIPTAARKAGIEIGEFAVAAIFDPDRPGCGHHRYIVEAQAEAEAPSQLADAIDATLMASNDDYESHRKGAENIGPPEVRFVTPGRFAAWMRDRGKLGGQHKVPRVISEEQATEIATG